MTNSFLTRIKWTAFMQKYANNLFPVVTDFIYNLFLQVNYLSVHVHHQNGIKLKDRIQSSFPRPTYLDVENKKIRKKRLHGVFWILKDIFFIIKWLYLTQFIWNNDMWP